MAGKSKIQSGNRFGRLLLVELAEPTVYVYEIKSGPNAGKRVRNIQRRWHTVCDCGTKKVILERSMREGRTTSCGCFHREIVGPKVRAAHLGKTRTKPGEAGLTRRFCSVRFGAKRRGIDFLLSRDEFRELSLSDCHYCGVSPQILAHNWAETDSRKNSEFRCNGIDRVDSGGGYSIDNCVPCCPTCNRAKLAMTVSEFLAWVERISNHQASLRAREPVQ